jgi:type IV pili sensor histidine kinase/response regulator
VPPEPVLSARSSPEPEPTLIPVARYGATRWSSWCRNRRSATCAQIEISIPPTFDASVGDALRHVLRTGYRLCDATEATALYALPLPARASAARAAAAARCLAGTRRPGLGVVRR